MNLRKLTTIGLAALTLLAAGCSDDDDEPTGGGDAPAATAPEPLPEPATNEATEGGVAAKLEISKETDRKPRIPTPGGKPPADLQIHDVVDGKGRAAKAGDRITVQYVGVLFANGKQFDASWDAGQPFDFMLGFAEVIPGWDLGIEGMKKGGRRTLVIPAELAYGPQATADIPANSALVFVVDLLGIEPG